MVQLAWIEDDIKVLDFYTPVFEANGFHVTYYEDFDCFFDSSESKKCELILTELIVDGEAVIDCSASAEIGQLVIFC